MSTAAPASSGVPASRAAGAALLALILLFTATALVINHRKSLWLDEAFTLESTRHGPAVAFRRAVEFEMQPPVYFTALALWRGDDPTIEHARLASTLAVVAGLLILWRLGARLGTGRAGWILPVLAGLAPRTLWAATEARTYGFTFLFASGSCYWFVRGWLAPGGPRPREVAWHALWSALACFTFYYSVVLVAAQFLVALYRRPPRWAWAGFGGLALALLLWAPVVARQVAHPLAQRESLGREQNRLVAEGLFTVFTYPSHLTNSWELLLAAIVIPAVTVLVLRAHRSLLVEEPGRGLLLVAALTMTGLAVIGFGQLGLLRPRHWTMALPPMLVIGAYAISRGKTALRRWAVLGAVAAWFAAGSVPFALRYRGPSDISGAAAWLAPRIGPEDLVVSLNHRGALPLAYYLPGDPRSRLDICCGDAIDAGGIRRLSPASDSIVSAMSGAVAAGGRAWVLIPTYLVRDGRPGLRDLLDRLEPPGVMVTESTSVTGLWVGALTRPAPPDAP